MGVVQADWVQAYNETRGAGAVERGFGGTIAGGFFTVRHVTFRSNGSGVLLSIADRAFGTRGFDGFG